MLESFERETTPLSRWMGICDSILEIGSCGELTVEGDAVC
jgi:hypothetical protein